MQLIERQQHKKRHGRELTDEQRQKYRDNLNNVARPKAIEWHKSEEGREWHREQWKISLGKVKHEQKPKILKCLNCGKEYETTTFGTTKFCSNNCKSAYRRKLGIDNVTRKCKVCNTEYTTNKYSKRVLCSECWRTHRSTNGD